MSQWDDYLNSVNGQPIDVDGNWGPQCWDLWSHYAMNMFGASMWQTSTDSGGNVHVSGYACGIWHGFGGNLNWAFTPIGPDQPAQRGDVAIWEYGCAVGPLSHVALVVEDWGGSLYCMTQNPGNAHYGELSKDGLLGYLRPDNQSIFDGGSSAPSSVSVNGNVSDLAAAVLRGEFGNGPDRQAALGARYDEVQAEVNRILSGGAPAPAPAPAVSSANNVVQPGDGYWHIAQRNWGGDNATIEANMNRLIELNGAKRLFAGDTVILEAPAPTPAPVPAPAPEIITPPVVAPVPEVTPVVTPATEPEGSTTPATTDNTKEVIVNTKPHRPATEGQIKKLIATADVWEPIQDPNAPVIPDNVAKPLWLILALVSSSTPYAFGLTVVNWGGWDATVATQAAALIVAWSGTLASVLGLSRFSKSTSK